jgi:hypothetical protein
MNAQRHQLFFEAEALEPDTSDHPGSKECLVKKVMNGAELHMQQYLQQHTIQVTRESHGFLTRDGINPSEFRRIAKEQINAYPSVQFVADAAVTITSTELYQAITAASLGALAGMGINGELLAEAWTSKI